MDNPGLRPLRGGDSSWNLLKNHSTVGAIHHRAFFGNFLGCIKYFAANGWNLFFLNRRNGSSQWTVGKLKRWNGSFWELTNDYEIS